MARHYLDLNLDRNGPGSKGGSSLSRQPRTNNLITRCFMAVDYFLKLEGF
jgi:hypothetical protein